MGGTKVLSWSLSRARMFEECPRRYYYTFYLAPLGIYEDAPEEAKLAYEMKYIKSLDMWIGDVVHQTIQWMLEQSREGKIVNVEDARAEIMRRLRQGWQGSRNQLWRKNPPDVYPNLFEHYYNLEVNNATKERLKNKALTSITNFAESEILEKINQTPADRWLPIDKNASFYMDGILMYVKFDFALKDGKRILVYDWKTGSASPHESRQLACYAMYTSSTWNAPIENIAVCPTRLHPDFHCLENTVSFEEIEDTKAYLKQSFEAMVSSLQDSARNIAVMDDFPPTCNLHCCLKCSFKGICELGKYASGDLDDLIEIQDEE